MDESLEYNKETALIRELFLFYIIYTRAETPPPAATVCFLPRLVSSFPKRMAGSSTK
jgi:hypothetical protein